MSPVPTKNTDIIQAQLLALSLTELDADVFITKAKEIARPLLGHLCDSDVFCRAISSVLHQEADAFFLDPVLALWFGSDRPLNTSAIAYRGEHGEIAMETPLNNGQFQTRLGSLSFSTIEVAKHYALNPNYNNDTCDSPRLYKATIELMQPVMVEKDAFIDFSLIIDAIGADKACKIAIELNDHLFNQDGFPALMETDRFSHLPDDLAQWPLDKLEEILRDSYIEAYLVFDKPEYVQWFKDAGYDGAIHWGNGKSAQKVEYKVFYPAQVTNVSVAMLSKRDPEAVEFRDDVLSSSLRR